MASDTDTTYNGWKNRETWSVALTIGNNEPVYHLALECVDYAEFVRQMRGDDDGERTMLSYETPEGVSWSDSGLDTARLDELIAELGE